MLRFNTDGMIRQSFPFPDSIMDYIFKNVQPQHLIQLYPTCKFFYDKYRCNIIRHLEFVREGEEVFDPVKTIIRASNPALSTLTDFWISDSVVYRAIDFVHRLPEFSHCSIKKLELTKCSYWKEYEILTRAGTVVELKLMESFLMRETDGAFFTSIDDIIGQVPNAESIEISGGRFAGTTCASLISLNHKAKVSNIILRHMCGERAFDLELFTDFIYKNTADSCNIRVDFDNTMYIVFCNTIGSQMVPQFALGNDFTERIQAALEMKKNSNF